MRAVFLAVLVALVFAVGVSASSADWSAPADAWAPELSANELEGRHSEFMMALAASSTGPSAGIPPIVLTIKLNCTITAGPNVCSFNVTSYREAILRSYGFPKENGESMDIFLEEYTYDDAASSSSTAAAVESSTAAAVESSTFGRRLLAIVTASRVVMIFRGASKDAGVSALTTYTVVLKSLQCVKDSSYNDCVNGVAADYNVPSILNDPGFTALAAETIGVEADNDIETLPANGGLGKDFSADGDSRRTNGGYYFLAAVLIVMIVVTLVYFIVHKAATSTMAKSEPRRDELDMAPVVAAPAESQPIAAGGDQQMDYRSVFALKNNVLDKNAEEKAADEHNHNDVHFILHQ